MLHVIINNTRLNLSDESAPDVATADRIREAQRAMAEVGLSEVPILEETDSYNEIEQRTDVTSEETGDTLSDELPEKAFALAVVLDCSPLDCLYESSGLDERWTSNTEPGEYAVYDDSERDDAVDCYLDSMLEETVLREIPEAYQDYFDRDSWKSDQLQEIEGGGGYGSVLASYDGHEGEACIEGTYYYVYRVG